MENNNLSYQQEPQETTIDLLDLARAVWKHIWIVIIGIVVGAMLAFTITQVFITPMYQATSTIYILSKTTSITSIADLQIGSQLAADFEIIATTRELLEKVIDQESLDMTYEELKREVSVSNPTDSHMLRITVTDKDPELAARISNAISDELREEIANVMNTDRPSAVEKAVVPEHQYSPNVRNNTILGAVIVGLLAVIIIAIRHLADDTIKNADDVRKYLNLNTLASFPLVKGMEKKSNKKKK